MDYSYIRVDAVDGVVTITIVDPDNKNAVNAEMNREICDCIARLEADTTARVLILTGAGDIFCSGANMEEMMAAGRLPNAPTSEIEQELFPHREGIRRVVLALHRCGKPTIAAVNGPAIGSGVGLAAGCDIRIASADARFGWVFTRRGIIPDDGSLALIGRLIGYGNAYLWGITGGVLSAEAAHEVGFVQEVEPTGQALARAGNLAREIADRVPPLTAELFKRALQADFDRSLMEAVDFAAHAQTLARETADHAEAVSAYSERRAPKWSGS